MRSLATAIVVTICFASQANSQETPPQVDQDEVMRLGDTVQHVGDHALGEENADAFVTAMGPPESDADKWFISVLSMRGCAGCVKLKKDWATNDWLLALANPNDPKKSWAHYRVYDKDDKSQVFRFKNVKITAYPTIFVQPPRSRRYGDPATVVFQGVYQGDPEKLARSITTAIRRYVARLQSRPAPLKAGDVGQVGVDPPWQPAPKVDPWQPQPGPNFPVFDPSIPPQPAPVPVPSFPWSSVMTLVVAGFSVPAAIALVVWAISFIRTRRQAAGKPPIVDQATLDQVLALLQKLADDQPKPSASDKPTETH